MSTHECLAANALKYPQLRLVLYELQDSLAVWPAAGQSCRQTWMYLALIPMSCRR